MTQKEYKARKAAWQLALAEGRVVRLSETSLTSYPTVEMRDAAIAKAAQGGIVGHIVKVRTEDCIAPELEPFRNGPDTNF